VCGSFAAVFVLTTCVWDGAPCVEPIDDFDRLLVL
jgi:hypothetical protein